MCEPVTIAAITAQVGPMLATAVTSGVASAGLAAVSATDAINKQNQAAVLNANQAVSAMNNETASTTAQYIEQNRSLVQGGFDAILAGRSAEAEGYTSAISNGVQGASVKSMLRSNKQKTARGAGRTGQEMDSLSQQTGANYKHIVSKAQGRINSVPTTSFGIGDLAQIAAPMVNAQMD